MRINGAVQQPRHGPAQLQSPPPPARLLLLSTCGCPSQALPAGRRTAQHVKLPCSIPTALAATRRRSKPHRTSAVAAAAAAPVAAAAVHHAQSSLLGHSPWGIWAALAAAGCAGLWCEQTKWGKEMSGALLSTLFGLALSNLGVVPPEAPHVYGVVNSYFLPLAVPLLLFSADLRRVLSETGRLLGAFTWGALATVVGSLLAFWLMPLRTLGADGWKVAAALTARHIGGSVNYVAVSEALGLSPSARMAGLAADDLIVSAYFLSLYALARGVPPEAGPSTSGESAGSERAEAPQLVAASAGAGSAGGVGMAQQQQQQEQQQPRPEAGGGGAPPSNGASSSSSSGGGGSSSSSSGSGGGSGSGGEGGAAIEDSRTITVLHGATALALAAAICFAGTQIAAALRYKGGSITVITGITVTLATLFPRLLAPLRTSGEGLAAILMQLFFASVGASGSIAVVMQTAPTLFLWSAVAVFTHLGLVLVGERLFGLTRKESCLASNANIGGPTTAAGMAAAKGWRSSLVPALLIGIMGYATATFVGVGCAALFRRMQLL